MKRVIFTTIFLCITLFSFAQTNYDTGFKTGYKEGYCYNEFGCLPPIPPLTPIPYIGESNDSYQDGYNRGFKMGLEAKAKITNANKQQNQSGQGTYNQPTYQTFNYDLLIAQAMEAEQARLAQDAAAKQLKKEKSLAKMKQTREYYTSVQKYPTKIIDGWHKVVAMDNFEFCEDRKVYVVGNKITKYIIDDWMERKVSFSGPINNGKTLIKLAYPDSVDRGFVDIYFLENIIDSTTISTAPQVPGKISFWTDWKRCGDVKIYFSGMYLGTFQSYFPDEPPSCGQQGTITFTYKPGTYNFYASDGNKTWKGTVTISSGGCSTMKLGK